VGFIGLGASLELLAGYGAQAIGERIVALTDYACEELRRTGAVVYSYRDQPERCSGIVTFEIPGLDSREARRVCLERKVALSFRAGRLRISVHAYNNEEDIARLIEAIKAARGA
jgi:selenocysteine lyase/cysteine desulfurase